MGARRGTAAGAALALGLAVGLAGCGGGGAEAAPPPTSRPPTTAAPDLVWSGTVRGETEVDGNYRQGLARSGDGWIFSTNVSLYRTDGSYAEVAARHDAIPADLRVQGWNHIGDPDVADGVVWVPIERDDKDSGEQLTARYDEVTLAFLDAVPVPQHHNAFVAVDDEGVIWSADEFGDDTLLRYVVEDGVVVPREPLVMSRFVDRIQGADIVDGAAYLATDDERNGVYRVDLATGEVTEIASLGHLDGEGEGIDATALPSGLLHALVADEAVVPMWVVDIAVTSAPRP